MKTVGIRFILQMGSFISAKVTEAKAREIVKLWISGKSPVIFGDADDKEGAWAVKTDSIMGIHTFDMDAAMRQAQQGTPYPPGFSGSRN